MAAITTTFTKLLNVSTPIVSAAMAGASSGALAAKVTLAGSFGFTAAGYLDANALRSDLDVARSVFNNNTKALSASTLPIGVGYLGWILDEQPEPSEKITVALENRVTAVWFSFGNDLEKWINFVREYDSKRVEPHKTLVFVLVNTLEEALKAAEIWKVDVLIAQGNEAGGHGHSQAPPIISLLPEIRRAIPNGPPILAAGGIATGAQVAAMLALGAAGVVVGTRFLLTPESKYSDKQKGLLLEAKSEDTVRSFAYDVARGTLGWPEGIDGRALRTKVFDTYNEGLGSDEVKRVYKDGAKRGDPAGYVTWSGTSVGLIRETKPADEIVKELHSEAVMHLTNAFNLIVPI